MLRPQPKISDSDTIRFWNKVNIVQLDECWDWMGSKFRKESGGYGIFCINRKSYPANRIAYWFSHGLFPGEFQTCHVCDRPICCNPCHLFLGTVADNMADRNAKNRQATGDDNGRRTHPESVPRGSKHYAAKLIEQQVLEIKLMHYLGIRPILIAKIYGITTVTVSSIHDGKSWRHVPLGTREQALQLISKLYEKKYYD